MPATVVVGLDWGDEGKGKIIDYLAKDADLGARFNGGDNAGHTVFVKDQKFALHLLPSCVVREIKAAIGNGVAVNPDVLKREINEIESRGIRVDLTVDERAHVITPKHIEQDIEKNKGSIGSTGRGIGPCYEDRIGRRGIRMIDYAKEHPEFKRFLGDVSLLVNDYIDKGKNVLLEGAQGTLLSINWGTYHYVTSSEPTAGGACTGLGIGPRKIDKVIGVTKAYPTRVGRGPFPTELGTDEQTINENKDDQLTQEDIDKANHGDPYYTGKFLRKRGAEYGTTTGRARRTGWFDAVAGKYSCRINGVDEIALTKLDVLGGLDRLNICKSYETENGEITDVFPSDLKVLENCKPVYAVNNGWKDISNVVYNVGLPNEAKNKVGDYAEDYVANIENILKAPVTMIGVGPERNQIILR